MILKGYAVPHPPIILPEVGRGEEKKIADTIAAYKRVAEEIKALTPDTIVLSSPHAPFYRDAFYIAGGDTESGNLDRFRVPGVDVRVDLDREYADVLSEFLEDLGIPHVLDHDHHEPMDHAALIPLRFIQEEYRDFKLVHLGLSLLDSTAHSVVGKSIRHISNVLDRRVVFIASGDLSHVLKEDGPYGFKPEGPEFDTKIVRIFKEGHLDELYDIDGVFAERAAECGLRSFQIMAGAIGTEPSNTEVYSYEGPFGVGYAVAAFDPSEETPEDGIEVVFEDPWIALARKTIETFIESGQIIHVPDDLPDELHRTKAGAFVTLHKQGRLRGCIGTIEPTRDSLAEEIIYNAISAATRDPRFPAVTASELDDLDISVDVLGEAEPIDSLDQLDVKRYGVIVSHGFRRGLLLPDIEGVDTDEEQVDIARQKAGIAPGESYELERFEVIRHEPEFGEL